jgi:hypothetical protein
VTGEHFDRVERPRAEHACRRLVNLATVTGLRGRGGAALVPSGDRYRKVFVVGCGRSGTSWVQRIVALHPSVITSQESHAYEVVYGNIAPARPRSIPAWTKVLHRHDLGAREARYVGLHWWVDRQALCGVIAGALATRDRAPADVAEDAIEAVFDAYFDAQGGTSDNVLLEKTPGHLAYAGTILRRYPHAKVVEVVRDGRDVCVSMQMQALTLRWPPSERAKQIETWTTAVRRGMQLRGDDTVADRVLLVRYEDLKADPLSEITRLYGFLGFDTAPDAIAAVADRTDFRHQQQVGSGSHTRRGEVGDWRNHFSDADEGLFRSMAGDAFEAVGYRY